MNGRSQRTQRFVWIGLGMTLALLFLALLLAILKLTANRGTPLPVYNTVAPFTLTNQTEQAVSRDQLRGHVWVADIIFTRCAGPCPRMTRRMKQIQDALPLDSRARLVTLTTDPDFDTPAVLKQYGERFGADFRRWSFLTGTKRDIAALAVDSLKLTALEKKPEERQSPEDLFIHSTIFVLVDKQGRLRGVFETEGEGLSPEQVQLRILNAIRKLEREE